MWPFMLTRTYVFSKTIPTSREELLRVVHDPMQSIALSPLFKFAEQDPKDPAWYTVTERLPVLGGLSESSTTFRCSFANNETGRYTEVFAGVGTHMDCTVLVEEIKENPNSAKFTEVVVLKVRQRALPFGAFGTVLDLFAFRGLFF